MNPWFAKSIVLVASLAIIVVPAFVHRRDGKANVMKSRRGPLESVLLALTSVGFVVPLVWVVVPVFAFAEYQLHPAALVVGSGLLATGLWLIYRSHTDLGTNWSITLELREKQKLVTHGVYRHLRHPMYLALLVYSAGQAVVLPNWLAGPCYFVALTLLVVFRIGPEERLMLDEFGKDYEEYMSRTRRLIPFVW